MFNSQPQATKKLGLSTTFTFFLRCVFTLWMMISSAAYAEKSSPTLLVVGDSLSAAFGIPWESGWVQQLETQYASQWQVINASISGDTTAGGLARLPQLLNEHRPQIVFIELGGNDGLRGYPIKTIQQNLEKMIQLSQQHKATVVLAGMQIPPNYGKRYTEGFAQLFVELSDAHNLLYIPFLLENVATRPELMQSDRIHPTEEAQSRILSNVLTTLRPLLDKPDAFTVSQ